MGMPGEKKPATVGADPDNQPLQYYLTQLESGQGTKLGKIGKVKIAWRQTGDTDDETTEREPKRQKLAHYTQPQNTDHTKPETPPPSQNTQPPHDTHSPQPPPSAPTPAPAPAPAPH